MTRQRLGNTKTRLLKDQRLAHDPKGLPEGAYMIIEYDTSFEHVPNSAELLTLMREPTGLWKVLTYQVD